MGYIDIHSHIIPSMDDGSKSMQQSLDMLRIACEEGVDVIFATPHNMPGKGRPSQEVVESKLNELREAAEQEGIDIEILLGTEYYYREEVLELMEDEAVISMNGSEYLLVEFDPMVEKIYFRNALRDVLASGYRPIVAHVERYAKVMEDISMLRDVRKMGALLQINAMSVTGDNGRQAKKDTKKLLKEHLVDFVATDAHSNGRRAPYMAKCATVLHKKYGNEYASELLYANAEKYLFNND